jgi:hypothetical protein
MGAPEVRVVEEELPDMPGQDAFLDVLTNMVGIIILLVVVIGIRTSRATIKAAVEQVQVAADDDTVAKNEVEKARLAVRASESEANDLVHQAIQVRGETALRDKERTYLTTYVAAFEQELNQRRSLLSAEQQRDYDLRRKLAESQLKLDNLAREQVALLSAPSEVEAIENQPTPLAQRAVGNRVYLYLSAGRVATIPKELFDATMEDLKENAWRLNGENHFIRTVGPVGGFRLRYLLALQAVRLKDSEEVVGVGAQRAQVLARPQLVWFKITPERTPLGETVEEALQPNSQFRQTLRENPCDTSVVVIAVYPDSIHELQQLKRELYSARYSTAYVPFKMGQPIRGVPTGSSMQARSGEVFTQ